MDHEDIIETIITLNDTLAKADALAAKCRGMIRDLYVVPLDEDHDWERSRHLQRKYPWHKTDEVGGEFFFPCDEADKSRVRPSITSLAGARYGAGKVSVRSATGGFNVIRKA